VRPDQPETGLGRRCRAHPEGDDAAAPADDEVPAARDHLPAVDLGQLGEAGGGQPADDFRAGVRRRGRGVDEGPQVVAEGELVGRGGVSGRHARHPHPAPP
jgi:hypothetical protein